MNATENIAKADAFLRLIQNLLAGHVDSYTGSREFMVASEPDGVATSGLGGFVQCHVTMPDGSEYRIEIEAVEP